MDIFGPHEAEVGVSVIIRQNHDEIGLLRRRSVGEDEQHETEKSAERHAGSLAGGHR